MGHLLRHVQKNYRHPAFNFRVDLIGKTVFFTRLSRSLEEKNRDAMRYGRGYTQSHTSSQTGIDNIGTHQRVIKYSLGGLRILLDFEADAFDETKVPGNYERDLTTQPSAFLTLEAEKTPGFNTIPPKRAPPALRRTIPHSALVRIETRANHDLRGAKTLTKQFPRLWLRQINYLALAWHFDGVFHPDDMKKMDVQSGVKEWEEKSQEDIRNLIFLLKKIAENVKATPSRRMEVFCEEGGHLEKKEIPLDTHAILPKSLVERWSNPAPKIDMAKDNPAQPTKDFSAPIAPQSTLYSVFIDEDLIDLTSEPSNDQTDISPAIGHLIINHAVAKLPGANHQEATLSMDRPQSVVVPHTHIPAVIRPAENYVVMKQPATHTPATSILVASSPAEDTFATSSPIAKISAADIPAKKAPAEDNPTVHVLPADTHEDSSSEAIATLPSTNIKDLPNYNCVAPACLLGTAYAMAVSGPAIGGIVVTIICAAIYTGYLLCKKINSLPPIQMEYPLADPAIDPKLHPAQSNPKPQAGRAKTIPRPVSPNTRNSFSALPGKSVEKKLVEKELITTRLPETDAVRTHTATFMPLGPPIFIRYGLNKQR